MTASGLLIAVRPRTFANFLNSSGSIPFIIFCTTPETNSKIPHPSAFMGEYDGFYGDFAHTLPCRLVDPNAVRVVDLKLSKLRRA